MKKKGKLPIKSFLILKNTYIPLFVLQLNTFVTTKILEGESTWHH